MLDINITLRHQSKKIIPSMDKKSPISTSLPKEGLIFVK